MVFLIMYKDMEWSCKVLSHRIGFVQHFETFSRIFFELFSKAPAREITTAWIDYDTNGEFFLPADTVWT